jgi:hypothetical protein
VGWGGVTSIRLVLYVFCIYINIDSNIVHMESVVDRVSCNGNAISPKLNFPLLLFISASALYTTVIRSW